MSTPPATFVSEAEYLERERKAEFKSEYYNGEMFAMSGGSPAHAWIIGNILGELREQLKGRPCRVAASDLRVRIKATGLYTYPDVMVVCGDPQYADERNDTLLNPVLLVEVLSPSTRDYDRGMKAEHYRQLPTLSEYLIVAQDRPHVEQWTRQPENRWLFSESSQLSDSIQLTSVGCALPLTEIYDKIDFATGS